MRTGGRRFDLRTGNARPFKMGQKGPALVVHSFDLIINGRLAYLARPLMAMVSYQESGFICS